MTMNVKRRDQVFNRMIDNLRTAERLARAIDGDDADLSIDGLTADQLDQLAKAYYSASIHICCILHNAERRPARASRARSTDGTGKVLALQET